jgi:hypothetical protein
MRAWIRVWAILLPLVWASVATAWEEGGIDVDVELVLAVDVSRSISPEELILQRVGYAEALTSPEVLTAIRDGFLGRIAVTYFEWAGADMQRTVVDWSLIETEADALAVADLIRGNPAGTAARTSLSAALIHAAGRFEGNGFNGTRRIIDISGDGPNNAGPPVQPVRDAVVARGIVINGLPLLTNTGPGGFQRLDDLDLFFRDCVIGGPGAFLIPVTSWQQFAEAVRRKLVLEIADLRLPAPATASGAVVPAQFAASGHDCMIGERMWNQRWMAP